MKPRKKILIIFSICYVLVATFIFITLKRIQNNFSEEKLNLILSKTSQLRDKTDDLCRYRIIGDPENVGKKFVKINFWCGGARESRNTLSLAAVDGCSYEEILREFGRIIGFDYEIIEKQGFICLLNDQPVKDPSTIVVDAATIDCFADEGVLKDVKKNF